VDPDTRLPKEGQHSAKGKGNARRVLLIGLDMADAELIDRWCEQGYLPSLMSLRDQGVWGRLGTTAEVMHVSSWPTIHTGTLPGKHGIYHAYQINAGEQDIHRSRAKECSQPPFWKFLDAAGRPCVVMDAFFNHPVEEFQGTQILEYGTWTWFADPMGTPKRVWKELNRKFGPYPSPEHTKVLTVPEPKGFRDLLTAAVATKSGVVRWLMRERPWEMFYVTFAETHPAGHYLWHLSDPSHPAYPPEKAAGLENPLRDVYVAVDSAIGEILAELDDGVTVIVTSGDGIGPNYAGCHMIPEILNRLGLYYGASVGRPDTPDTVGEKAKKPKKGAAAALRELIPLSARQSVTRFLPRSVHYRMSMKWVNTGHDWTRSKAFTIPNANEGYVRVNLKGREPQGIVDEGSDYRKLIDELEASLKELVNPQNGRPAVSRVFRIDDVFPGEKRPNLPDLAVTWDLDARVLGELGSDRCGKVKKQAGYRIAPYYTGNHRPDAFLIARGPGIAEGGRLDGGHIVDLAPTLMTILEIDPPAHMDGRVLDDLIR
jgi:predicted AlkP superfamily phosphohydrolase/phosphomutase